MTFHGKPRADDETLHHVHESPWVMLVPLFVLAPARSSPAVSADGYFVGEERGDFWKSSILVLPQHDSLGARDGITRR